MEANPKEGKIVSGSASINSKAGKVRIVQSSKNAVIHWKDFSIQKGEITEFSVSHQKGATLNRVISKKLSEIAGCLRSNGKIYLINPNGILVTPTGVVNTAGVVFSTLNISDDDFLFDRYLSFSGESDARVVNLGKISTAAGDVVFVGQVIENQGTIDAPEGGVYLAAGKEVLILPEGERRIQIKVPVSESISGNSIDHSGMIEAAHVEIEASGGNPYALAVKSSGAVHVKGFTKREGQIFLTANDQNIEVSGILTAEKENGSGGDIHILGNRVQVTSGAQIVASSVAKEGNGGSIYILGNAWASLESDIYAQGGVKKGNGGFVEFSAPILECLASAYTNARDGVSPSGKFLL
ncbi:MAG: filamentous hemagglutinin N-terminal domain-containing protein, partial [Rhabdochlamydiaceae bacterium]